MEFHHITMDAIVLSNKQGQGIGAMLIPFLKGEEYE